MKEISRREFVKRSILSEVGISVLPNATKAHGQFQYPAPPSARYIAAYDTESAKIKFVLFTSSRKRLADLY